MDRKHSGSAFARGWSSGISGVKTFRFWFGEAVVGAIVGWVASAFATPDQVPSVLESGYLYISVFLALVTFAVLIFIGNIIKAPYWQRNEARFEVDRLQAEIDSDTGSERIPIVTPPSVNIEVLGAPKVGTQQQHNGFPDEEGESALWVMVHLNVSAVHIDSIQAVELRFDDRRLPLQNELPKDILRYSTDSFWYFHVPNDIRSGRYSAQVAIRAAFEWFGSQDFDLDIPEPNSS